MKVVVIGATGTIGKPVADALEKRGHEVVRASRKSAVPVDIESTASIRGLFDKVGDVDAVVCCAGGAGLGCSFSAGRIGCTAAAWSPSNWSSSCSM